MAATIRTCMTEKEYEAWDDYVFEMPGAHYFQTYGWLKSYEPMGFTPHVLVYEVDGIIFGGVAFLTVKLPLLPWRIFIVPHGPLTADPDGPGWMLLMERLDEICREQHAIYTQLYPHELTEKSVLLTRLEEIGFSAPAKFTSHKFSSTPVTIDLDGKSKEDLLNEFRKNTRYYIRRALSGRLSVRTDVDQRVFDEIYKLFLEHGEFRGYSPRPQRSLKVAWDWFAPRGRALFIQAWHEETLVGAIFVVFTGRTAYYLAGATRRQFSKDYPAELMHWHAICHAIEGKMNTYDLTSMGVSGVAQFKTGFRPMCRCWHDPRTKVYRPLATHLVSFADKHLRSLVRKVGRYRANTRL